MEGGSWPDGSEEQSDGWWEGKIEQASERGLLSFG